MNWYLSVLKKYVVFSGRARRKEYWMFYLINILISLLLGVVAGIIAGASGRDGPADLILWVYTLAILLPSLGVTVRRLHDTGRSGWWLLIGLIPVIGAIVLLVFTLLDGQPGQNEYGPDPKAEPAPV